MIKSLVLPSTAHFYKTNPVFERKLVKQIFNEEYHKGKICTELVDFPWKDILVKFCIACDLSKKEKKYDLEIYFGTIQENWVFC